MPRIIRKTAVLAKIEATYGVDAAPSGATDALLISDASFEISYNNVARDIMRPYLGASEQLVGTRKVDISFTVEAAGSGTVATAPAWGPLMQACGMAETVVATKCVEYNPVSGGFKSATLYYSVDGVRYKALGCRGSFVLAMGEGERPVFKFSMTGLDGGVVAAADPAVTLTAWKTPAVVTNQNSPGVVLGCGYTAPGFTAGTVYASRGMEITLGQDVRHVPLLGGETVEITGRETTGTLQLDLSAADVVAFMAAINGNQLTTLGFTHGTNAGSKVLVYAPAVQRVSPKVVDFNGQAHLSMDLRFTPTSSGNDEIRIIAA
ncbi:MAG: hypothetical protein JSR53_09415 [Proteobacteria bacterium]|nr:hypothetical protein [Pseudomonadota bacterium]